MRFWLLRWLCGLCFLGVSSSVFSSSITIYYAKYGTYFTPNQSGITQACTALISGLGLSRVHKYVSGSSETGDCISSPSTNTSLNEKYGTYHKAVLDCPYGSSNGTVCDDAPSPPTPEECASSSPGIFRGADSSVVNSNGSNYVLSQSPGNLCYGQCTYSTSSRASSCYFLSGSTSQGFCNYTGTPTGEVCSGQDALLGQPGDQLNPPETPDVPPSDPNDPGCPDGYGWSGTTCAKLPDDGGGESGGDAGGGDSGGGTDGGGGSGGDSGSGSGDGSGESDGSDDGTGGGTGDGTGDGSIPGDGAGEGETPEEPSSSVGGEACSANLACEGDAVACAVLRQQKQLKCWAEEDRDYSKAKPQIDSELAKPEYSLKESTVDASGFFNTGSRFFASSCPAPKSLHIESFNRTIQLSYEPICDFASAMSYIVVAMASLFFMVYVGRSFGGE